jgi:hypothetical protein
VRVGGRPVNVGTAGSGLATRAQDGGTVGVDRGAVSADWSGLLLTGGFDMMGR